jgi:hypothetical protein
MDAEGDAFMGLELADDCEQIVHARVAFNA